MNSRGRTDVRLDRLRVCRTSALALLSAIAFASAGAFATPARASQGWTPPKTIDDGATLTAISCPSARYCMAVDELGGAVTFNGRSWGRRMVPKPGWNLQFGSVSCVAGGLCAVGDLEGNVLTHGKSWSAAVRVSPIEWMVPASPVESVSCSAVTFCYAVTSFGRAVQFNGSTWGAPLTIDANGVPTSVSCTSRSFCAAVDAYGYILRFNGSSWTARKRVDGNEVLISVSCTSRTFCIAVDQKGKRVEYNGRSWSRPRSIDQVRDRMGSLRAVSCASRTFCVAVDGNGNAVKYNGRSWTLHAVLSRPLQNGFLDSVSCPSVGYCSAVSSAGRVVTYRRHR